MCDLWCSAATILFVGRAVENWIFWGCMYRKVVSPWEEDLGYNNEKEQEREWCFASYNPKHHFGQEFLCYFYL